MRDERRGDDRRETKTRKRRLDSFVNHTRISVPMMPEAGNPSGKWWLDVPSR